MFLIRPAADRQPEERFSCARSHCPLRDSLARSGFIDPQLQRLHAGVQRRSFTAKETLFQQGAGARWLYVLHSGFVKLATTLSDGRHQGLRLAGPGSIVGIEALGDERYPHSAEAVTAVEVCVLRQKDLLAAVEGHPRLSLAIIAAMNRELHHSHDLICSLGRLSSTERLAAFLLSVLPTEDEEGEEGDTPLPLSRTDIAEMLGLTLETVSRVLSRLGREKIIWLQPNGRRCRLLDRGRLELLAGGGEPRSEPLRQAME